MKENQDDQTIHLIDLFSDSVRLIHQAGNAIRSFQSSLNHSKIFQKKNFIDKQSTEPLTMADLLSHSILNDGLKHLYRNIQIVSEEKNPRDKQSIQRLINKHIDKRTKIDIPSIDNHRYLTNIPLSSVSVWIDPLDATQEFTENLLQYVTVMLCVTIDQQPTIGMIYAPFTKKFVWGWVDVDHSKIIPEPTNLLPRHRDNIDEIVISRSHAGQAHQILKKIYHGIPYQIIPAAGSGYKTIHVLEQYSDYYLHLTPIKKWDVCAPDALLRANQGKLTTLTNRSISYDHHSNDFIIKEGLLATYKRNHDQILKLFDQIDLHQLSSPKV